MTAFADVRKIMQQPETKENMSRSQPNDRLPHPCKFWYKWNGEKGNLRYYDKELKENVEVALPFEFILLDRLSSITGWHNNSESGIVSNEVRDTRNETLIVRAFKQKESIAEGFYGDIRDKVKANGGKFTIMAYFAFTDDSGEIAIGSLAMHGAAMSAWIEFENDKAVKPELYKRGIRIASTKEGSKGTGKNKIEWKSPVFELIDLPREVNDSATEKDRELQKYFASYFKRAKVEQASEFEHDDINQELSTKPEDENQDPSERPF